MSTAHLHTAEEFLANEPWCQRLRGIFAIHDKEKRGFLTVSDIVKSTKKFEDASKADPILLEKLSKEMMNYYGAMGITEGAKVTEEEFLQHSAKFAAEEIAKKDKGVIKKMSDAYFDVLDVHNDGGITLNEWKAAMKASDFDEESAQMMFKLADTNQNGKLERNELNDFQYNYFCQIGNSNSNSEGPSE